MVDERESSLNEFRSVNSDKFPMVSFRQLTYKSVSVSLNKSWFDSFFCTANNSVHIISKSLNTSVNMPDDTVSILHSFIFDLATLSRFCIKLTSVVSEVCFDILTSQLSLKFMQSPLGDLLGKLSRNFVL